jgi:hypothetical protein
MHAANAGRRNAGRNAGRNDASSVATRTARALTVWSGIIGLALLGACSGTGAGQADGSQLASGETGEAKRELECRKFLATGSNVPKQVCRSTEAWARIDKVEREVADEYGRQTRENSATVAPGFSRGQPTVL